MTTQSVALQAQPHQALIYDGLPWASPMPPNSESVSFVGLRGCCAVRSKAFPSGARLHTTSTRQLDDNLVDNLVDN